MPLGVDFSMIPIEEFDFASHAPAGYYVACGLGFDVPKEEYNHYPAKWTNLYTERGYMSSDPVIRWAYENTGICRWSELDIDGTNDILRKADEHGLSYGIVVSYRGVDADGEKTIGTFARGDREFHDSEIEVLFEKLISLHNHDTLPSKLTDAELEVLLLLKQGALMKEVAATIGVSESAIKARLKNAKLKLGAKTNTHATSIASDSGLI